MKLAENNEFWNVQRISSRKEHEMYIHAENQNKCWSWKKERKKIGALHICETKETMEQTTYLCSYWNLLETAALGSRD